MVILEENHHSFMILDHDPLLCGGVLSTSPQQ